LTDNGINQVLLPKEGFNSESVLELPECKNVSGSRCLIVRGDSGRELLATTLRERGAKVDYVAVYKKLLPIQSSAEVCKYLRNKELSALFIYSAVALKNLLLLLAEDKVKEYLLATPLVVISRRVYLAAKEVGFKQVIIAAEASDAAMVNALLNGESCG